MRKLLILLLLPATSAFSQQQPQKESKSTPVIQAPTVNKTSSAPTPASLSPCAGGNITMPAGVSGSSYQWQVNTGSGFNNLSNGGVYSGATTNTLQITGAPTSLYGYEYRCVADGNFGPVYILKFVSTWTGSSDNNWENPANWNCNAVPDGNTDVIINSGTPMLNSNRSVRTFTSSAGVNVTVKNGANLNVVK